jgi:hypothetical protein
MPAEYRVELEAVWWWHWLCRSHYGRDKENSNSATGIQTLVMQSVAGYCDDSYQTDKVIMALIVF